MAPETTGKVKRTGLEAKALVEEVQQIIKQKAQKVCTCCCRLSVWLQGATAWLQDTSTEGVHLPLYSLPASCGYSQAAGTARLGNDTKAEMVNRCRQESLHSMALSLTCSHLF